MRRHCGEERLQPYNDKYSNETLESLLNACKSSGFLDKKEWEKMIEIKNQLRNGYSHADASKIFKGAKGRFVLGSFTDLKQSEFSELSFKKIPFLQDPAYDNFSESHAMPYFTLVLDFVASTIQNMISN